MKGNWLSAAIVVSTLGTAFAQERPVFTGTWESDASTLVITDTPALFTVERRANGETETLSFTFIGRSEAVQRFGTHDGVGGPTAVQETSAAWHEGHVDTFIARQVNGKTVTQNITYTMDASGLRMTVQRELQVHHGYEGVKSGGKNTLTEIYTKR